MKKPQQISPEVQLCLPYPFLKSFLKSPQQVVPFIYFHTPWPYRTPLTKFPSQQLPFAHRYLPKPFGFPYLQEPVNLSPFTKIYQPCPFFKNSENYPLYVLTLCLKIPMPFCLLDAHCPQQKSPLGDLHIPKPFFLPFFHSPSKTSPLCHQNLPQPDLTPLTNYPLYIPSIFFQQPQNFSLSLQSPSNINFSDIMSPLPFLLASVTYPKYSPSSFLQTLKVSFRTKFFILKWWFIGLQLFKQSTYSSSQGMMNNLFFL